jgi:Uma2 family endonuclease
MALLQEEMHTIEEIEALPEQVRAELIDGRMIYMETPTTNHQRIVARSTITIGNYIDEHHGTCEVFPAPFAVYLEQDTQYVEPDVVVVCDPEKLDRKGCHGAPNWLLEVTSKSTKSWDHTAKLGLYARNGVEEYWIVDVDARKVFIYLQTEEYEPRVYTFEDGPFSPSIFPDLKMDFGRWIK